MFPYAYQELKIGKLIGMPVAGTGTAVWWEDADRQYHLFWHPDDLDLGYE
jgi:C-terminal processing protease CtpA/Prc